MPAYNAASFLEIAVKSIRAQTYTNWELLIVNDASKDATLKIAETLKAQDERIQVFDQLENQGVAKTRNTALQEAKGKYIAFLDSDDVWYPQKLEKQVYFMENEDVLVCYSPYQRINENGKELATVIPPKEIDYNSLLKSNFIGNLTGIYNAEILGKQFFSDYKHEDYVAWLALVKNSGKAKSVGEVLGQYRVYAGTTSSNKIKMLLWQWRIYRSSQSLGFLQSSWLMLCYGYYALNKRI